MANAIVRVSKTPRPQTEHAIAVAGSARGAGHESNAGISPQNGEDYEPIEDSYPE